MDTGAGDGPPPESPCDGLYDPVSCDKVAEACRFEPGVFYDADPDLGCTPAPDPSGFCTEDGAVGADKTCFLREDGRRVACFEVTVAAPPGWFPCGTEDPPWCDPAAPPCCCDALP